MSRAERRDYVRRVALRCLAAFVFWVMGVMLAAFMVTGAMFRPMGPRAMLVSLVISVAGGLVLAGRVLQLARQTMHASLERLPMDEP